VANSNKQPQVVFENVWAFPPNRHTLGGTAYLIVENQGNILVDCPANDPAILDFLAQRGGIRWLFLTHRGGRGEVKAMQQHFNFPVVVQEQEAYLLPDCKITAFAQELKLTPEISLLWTPGHSPGSSCLYYSGWGGILFSGRHLLPNAQGEVTPLRTAKTFHWPRQLKSARLILDAFCPQTLSHICPGANTGFLRGQRTMGDAYQQLAQLDLDLLHLAIPPL
jgi:glyoxylase-like metal-dependent hydrolase (beta-lactamase superfamily II)